MVAGTHVLHRHKGKVRHVKQNYHIFTITKGLTNTYYTYNYQFIPEEIVVGEITYQM